jgi:hypothetical protein
MGVPKSLLVAVAAILGLCALGGFALGVSSTMARHPVATSEEETPIAGNLPANVTIKDAQALAPPPPPPPPVVKPKAAPEPEAASDTSPAEDEAKTPVTPPPEAAPGAPPTAKPAAKLPDDLPPT